jgi:hypothetical protein
VWRLAAVVSLTLGLALATACDDTAIVIEIQSGRPVPGELDGVCLSVAALDAAGDDGAFARRYALPSVPQTLTVLPGGHGRVRVWARGERGGVETARAGAEVGVEDGAVKRVRLELPVCGGGGLAPRVAGQATPPAGARVAVLLGWRRPVIVAVGAGAAARWSADEAGLGELAGGLPSAPAGGVAFVRGFDADGDCDDDLLVAPVGAPAVLWRHDGDGAFSEADAGLGGLGALGAAAAGDVDHDGDLDLVVGAGGRVRLLRNDGAGRFAEDAAAVPAALASDPTAIALGDVSGDGHPDLVVGQGRAAAAPRRVAVNDPSGAGSFEIATGLLPEVPEQTRALVVGDADGDGDLDLVSAGVGAPVRLYVNRGDGRLEDRSFVRLPTTDAVDGLEVALADIDGDCLPDLAVARADGVATLWRGTDGGAFVDVALPAGGGHLALDDVDGDGVRDLVLGNESTLARVAPR